MVALLFVAVGTVMMFTFGMSFRHVLKTNKDEDSKLTFGGLTAIGCFSFIGGVHSIYQGNPVLAITIGVTALVLGAAVTYYLRKMARRPATKHIS